MPAFRTRSAALALALASLVAAAPAAFGYDPPAGGSLLPILSSPQALATGPALAELDLPWSDRVNPAASAAQQRPVLEAGFAALTDFGSQGAGGTGSVAFSLPVPYAVWGGSLSLVSTPSSMTGLPLGTIVGFRGSIAKALSERWLVGGAVGMALGGNGSFGWGAGIDLGVLNLAGDLGPFKDFRWGATFTGLGKGYSIPATGILGGQASSFPPPFTLGATARGSLLKTDELEASIGASLSAPSFQDLELGLAAELTWRRSIGLRIGWDLGLRETIAGNPRDLIPSFGLTALLPVSLGSDDPNVARRGWSASELTPSLSFAPLFGGIWAMGGGASLALGRRDVDPPSIVVSYPSTPFGAVYLSPNNDGAKDGIEFPVAISDRGNIVRWSFSVSDASGKVVRKVLTEAPKPGAASPQAALESLTYVKQGVALPDKVVWNGATDEGAPVPDGEYTATLEAVDENGNAFAAGPYPIVVDKTPPSASVVASEDPPVFSPDGDGSKDSIVLVASGSEEDLWKAQILDAAGKAVKTAEYKKGGPGSLSWDGKGADGSVVPDGVYSYVLSSSDRAGNSFARRVDNIVVNTQQPPVNLIIDLAAFSPNGDGVKDAVNLFPSVPMRTGIVGWKVSVADRQGREVWAVSGTEAATLRDRVAFDGRDTQARPLPEGDYRAALSVSYINGHRPQAVSPYFALDVTAPDGSASSDRQAFNPAGGPGQDTVRFAQAARKEARWTAEIIGPAGSAVRSWSFSPLPDPSIDWDGTDDSGKPVPDGSYAYRLRAVDGAGNAFVSEPVVVTVDTAAKAIRLLVDQRAFSPLPASPKNRITFSSQVQGNDRIRSYEMSVIPLDASGAAGAPGSAVRVWRDNKGVPATIVWDGLAASGARAPEGRYAARLAVSYLNGDSADATSAAFVLDTVAPSATLSASPLLFSPSETSSVRSVTFAQRSAPGDDWEGRLINAAGQTVRTWSWKGQVGNFGWNGTDEAGNLVPDGSYRYELSSSDAAGNRGLFAIPAIVVDKRPVQVFITASEAGISPNGDGVKDEVSLNLIVKLREGIGSWHIGIVDSAGAERSSFGGEGGEVPNRVVWGGRDEGGEVVSGEFYAYLRVDYLKGERAEAHTGKILVDVAGPKATVAVTPEVFSPDGDGYADEVQIALSVAAASEISEWRFEILERAEGPRGGTRPFKSWSGKGDPAKAFSWDGHSDKGELVQSGAYYPFSFTAVDALGVVARAEGRLQADLLALRDGDKLEIRLPAIAFRPGAADFEGLGREALDRNAALFRRLAQILDKNRDFRVTIEGHANSDAKVEGASAAKIADEEARTVQPLTLARAELARKRLVEAGIDAKRISVAGAGSSAPVADFRDPQNRWKNERLDFVLQRGVAGQP